MRSALVLILTLGCESRHQELGWAEIHADMEAGRCIEEAYRHYPGLFGGRLSVFCAADQQVEVSGDVVICRCRPTEPAAVESTTNPHGGQ